MDNDMVMELIRELCRWYLRIYLLPFVAIHICDPLYEANEGCQILFQTCPLLPQAQHCHYHHSPFLSHSLCLPFFLFLLTLFFLSLNLLDMLDSFFSLFLIFLLFFTLFLFPILLFSFSTVSFHSSFHTFSFQQTIVEWPHC